MGNSNLIYLKFLENHSLLYSNRTANSTGLQHWISETTGCLAVSAVLAVTKSAELVTPQTIVNRLNVYIASEFKKLQGEILTRVGYTQS